MKVNGKSARVRRRQWLSVGLLTMVGILFIVDRSTLAIANHGSDLHLSPTQMGLLLSCFSLAYAFFQLPLGVLLDRVGARVVLGAGGLVDTDLHVDRAGNFDKPVTVEIKASLFRVSMKLMPKDAYGLANHLASTGCRG